MTESILDDLFLPSTEEEMEQQMLVYKKHFTERKKKIQEAVKEENLEFTTRHYGEIIKDLNYHKKTTIFLGTKKGIYGEPDTLGRLEFTIHENVDLKDIFIASGNVGRLVLGFAEKIIHFDIVAIYSDYRGYGLSEKLVSHFFDLYQNKFSDTPISIEFMTPIAEYLVRKVLKEKQLKNILNERYIQRFYQSIKEIDDIVLINNLKEKDSTLFPLEIKDYISKWS